MRRVLGLGLVPLRIGHVACHRGVSSGGSSGPHDNTGAAGREAPVGVSSADHAHGATTKTAQQLLDSLFDQWAARNGICNAVEFAAGAKQAYSSLGVVLQSMVDAAKTISSKERSVVKRVALLDESLRVEFLGEKRRLADSVTPYPPTTPAAAAQGMPHDEAPEQVESSLAGKAASVSEPSVAPPSLQKIIPISADLAKGISLLWERQLDRTANLLTIAAPNDYILSSQLILFHDGGKNVYTAHETTKGLQIDLSAGESGVNVFSGTEQLTSALLGNTVSANATAESSAKVPSAGAPAASAVATPVAADAARGKQMNLHGKSVPASALGMAIVCIDVVVPPARYVSGFEWFYKRIVGCDSDYERIATAITFASANVRGIAHTMDFISRMIFGRPSEYHISGGYIPLMGIPENIAQCPPATRKILSFYLGADKQWVLLDVVALSPTLTTPLPASL